MQMADQYVDKVHHLLPAPCVVPQLLQLLNKPDADNNDIVKLISHDPSLTANVLRISNSAYFAAATSITSMDEAVARLGSQQVYRLVVAISGAMLLAPPKNSGSTADELLDHSIATAVAAQLMAKDAGDDESLVFTAGLLHDLGKIVLAFVSNDFYKMFQDVESDQSALIEVERKLMGTDHAEIGGCILLRWNFPAELTSAVQFHHQPGSALAHQRLAAHVYLGNMVAYLVGQGYGHQPSMPRGDSEALTILNLTKDDLQEYVNKTSAQLKTMKGLFH
ncbi:MAG: HDOD domain-containing protein [Verrucomicrobiae bacterium]|nr:HDOD domain-containing protein [Verrucomicrobiae bacterium]